MEVGGFFQCFMFKNYYFLITEPVCNFSIFKHKKNYNTLFLRIDVDMIKQLFPANLVEQS